VVYIQENDELLYDLHTQWESDQLSARTKFIQNYNNINKTS